MNAMENVSDIESSVSDEPGYESDDDTSESASEVDESSASEEESDDVQLPQLLQPDEDDGPEEDPRPTCPKCGQDMRLKRSETEIFCYHCGEMPDLKSLEDNEDRCQFCQGKIKRKYWLGNAKKMTFECRNCNVQTEYNYDTE